ncbi:MAG TPA: hypothetical protein VFC33_18835 [Acidimicrobiia bacterium]|nr:hypothetical protein [Acidimicrobiia bacterium]
MSDGPEHDRERDGERDGEHEIEPQVDVLPEDLDVTAYVGPYVFPNTNRRRVTGALYGVVALACFAGYVGTSNGGVLAAAILLAAIAAYHVLAGWNLDVDQTEALVVATRTVGFPVGHASAQLAWRGLRSRPAWRILLYSADEPPSMRGLVELDGVDGHVMGEYTELNPEDWSQYGVRNSGGAGDDLG